MKTKEKILEEIRNGQGSITELLKKAWNAACDACSENAETMADKQSILNNKFEV